MIAGVVPWAREAEQSSGEAGRVAAPGPAAGRARDAVEPVDAALVRGLLASVVKEV